MLSHPSPWTGYLASWRCQHLPWSAKLPATSSTVYSHLRRRRQIPLEAGWQKPFIFQDKKVQITTNNRIRTTRKYWCKNLDRIGTSNCALTWLEFHAENATWCHANRVIDWWLDSKAALLIQLHNFLFHLQPVTSGVLDQVTRYEKKILTELPQQPKQCCKVSQSFPPSTVHQSWGKNWIWSKRQQEETGEANPWKNKVLFQLLVYVLGDSVVSVAFTCLPSKCFMSNANGCYLADSDV